MGLEYHGSFELKVTAIQFQSNLVRNALCLKLQVLVLGVADLNRNAVFLKAVRILLDNVCPWRPETHTVTRRICSFGNHKYFPGKSTKKLFIFHFL